jgi:UDP-N-acetyl-D-mannosaminuronate dehydrogenase
MSIALVSLGYVGLPLVVASPSRDAIAIDGDSRKLDVIRAGARTAARPPFGVHHGEAAPP